jgi:nucleotide-binding universal stress UspA family protein
MLGRRWDFRPERRRPVRRTFGRRGRDHGGRDVADEQLEALTMTEDRIVVGVDGSSDSLAAARWALDEALARGWRVELVHCWEAPRVGDPENVGVDFRTLEAQMVRSTAVLDGAFAQLASRVARNQAAGCPVERRTLRGPPGRALVTEATGAAMLVVGRHGRSRRADTAIGSVADHVRRHAKCATVVPAAVISEPEEGERNEPR